MSHFFLFLALANHSPLFPFSRLTLNLIYPTLKRQRELSGNFRGKILKFFLLQYFSIIIFGILPIG